MTHTLLACEPFARHTAFTLWKLQENPAGPAHKPVKVPVHYDGVTRHSLGRPARRDRPAVPPNPAPPMTARQAAEWLAHHRASGGHHDRAGEVGYIGAGFRPEGTGLVCVDLDDCMVNGAWTAGAQALIARFPGALIESSVSGTGAHIWFTAAGVGRRPKQITPLGEIEVYGSGQFIACGTVLSGDASVDHTAAVTTLLAEFWPDTTTASKSAGSGWDEVPEADRPRIIEELRSALPFCDQSTYDKWVERGMALATLGDDVGLPLWHQLSALHPDYDEAAVDAKWFDLTPTRTGYQAIFAHVKGRGWVNPRERQALPADAGAVFDASPGSLPAGAVLEAPASRQNVELSFMAASSGTIPGTIEKVIETLTGAEAGIVIARDEFLEQIIFTDGGSAPRQLVDEDYTDLRARFGRRGFKPITSEIMRSAIHFVARHNKFDSAVQWAESLVWDGVPRIDLAMSAFYGAEDTPYSRAVGAYLFTALAGRCLVPGVKADMAVILIGLQGAAKTSSVEALAPTPESFGEVDLKMRDTDLARSMRGKLVLEMAELNGLAGRDQEAAKAWISRRVEEWTPKFKEVAIRYPRRCVLVGTGNAPRFLDDETGARRFLPIDVGPVDVAALRAARDQCWAEGIARFRTEGIAWQQAEALAKAEHGRYQIVDEREALVAAWLAAVPPAVPGQELAVLPRGAVPVRPIDVAMGALNYLPSQFNSTAQKQIARLMKNLGYAPVKQRINGRPENTWMRTGT